MDVIDILGTQYSVSCYDTDDDPEHLNQCDGYIDTSTKKIVVNSMSGKALDPFAKGDMASYRCKVTRHEIIHAFLAESGLDNECEWACEEMVDWLAIQYPKLTKAFEELQVER